MTGISLISSTTKWGTDLGTLVVPFENQVTRYINTIEGGQKDVSSLEGTYLKNHYLLTTLTCQKFHITQKLSYPHT